MTTNEADRPAAAWYLGRTTHGRVAPFAHRFAYRTASILIDVDRLDAAAACSRLFSIDRFNMFSFHRRDHGGREDAPLRPWAETAFARAGIGLSGGRLELLCFPRVLGYVFNPLSVWFGHGPDGALRGVIYQVHNTFGDAHAYVCPATVDGVQRHDTAKIFHVSPFFPVSGRYRFKLKAPDGRYRLSIQYDGTHGDPVFFAAHAAEEKPLTTASARSVFFTLPLSTHRAIWGIHWEALKIWRKGGRYHRRPKPPAPVSVITQG